MNIKNFTLVFLLLISCGTVHAQVGKLVLNVTLDGLEKETNVYLLNAYQMNDTIASGKTRTGKIQLKLGVQEPSIFQLNWDGQDRDESPILFLGNDNAEVRVNIKDLSTLTVKGSYTHSLFESMQLSMEQFQTRYADAIQKVNNAKEGNREQAMEEYKEVREAIFRYTDSFISKNSKSNVSAFLLYSVSDLEQDPLKTEMRYKVLENPVQQSHFGKLCSDRIARAMVGAVGSPAANFTQNDPDGKPVSLASLRGKYVLIDFWASWCGPCRRENPNVVSAFNKFKSKNFTVLGVSLDRNKEAWVKAIADDKLAWTHVSDLKYWNNEVAQLYKIQSIPQNLLIDPQGKIIAKNLRGEDLQVKLAQLLK